MSRGQSQGETEGAVHGKKIPKLLPYPQPCFRLGTPHLLFLVELLSHFPHWCNSVVLPCRNKEVSLVLELSRLLEPHIRHTRQRTDSKCEACNPAGENLVV